MISELRSIVPRQTSIGSGEEPVSGILKTGIGSDDRKYYTLTRKRQVYTYYPETGDFDYNYRGVKEPQRYTKEQFISLIAAKEEEGQVVDANTVLSSQVSPNNGNLSRANVGRVFTDNSNQGFNRNSRLSAEITQAKMTCLQSNLIPGTIDLATFDKLISELLDKPITVSIEQSALYAKPEMPKLAALLLTCCDVSNIGLDLKQSDGSLTVLEGIQCLNDQVRTKRFLESVAMSIDKLAESKDQIHVVDAGCGAIPIFSIYAAMRSDKVHVTAIELNPNSLQIAQRLVNKLGLQNRITLVQGDATSYQPTEPIDLLVSETMHSGLTQEKIVPIMNNLVPKLNSDGIVLPGAVKVKIGLASIQTYDQANEMAIFGNPHRYIIPDWKDQIEFKPGEDLQRICFELDTKDLTPGTYFVSVSSEVQLPAGNLGDFDSLITTPQIILEKGSSFNNPNPWVLTLNKSDIGTKKVVVNYKPGDDSSGLAKLE